MSQSRDAFDGELRQAFLLAEPPRDEGFSAAVLVRVRQEQARSEFLSGLRVLGVWGGATAAAFGAAQLGLAQVPELSTAAFLDPARLSELADHVLRSVVLPSLSAPVMMALGLAAGVAAMIAAHPETP
jgi:hypothetical protein